MLSIRLPEDIEGRLEALAKATGRTKSSYAEEAIMTHLENMEDIYLAEAALERFQASGEKTISLEDMERYLALED